MPDLKIQFDFLGKDSIQYLNTVEVVPQVYKNIQVRLQQSLCRAESVVPRSVRSWLTATPFLPTDRADLPATERAVGRPL
jgi:hypothetical protein